MGAYVTLRQAILTKKPCRVSKPGEPERKICPYRIGKSSSGDENVLYYQYDGYSARGLKPYGSSENWRCNRVSDIATAEIIDEAWRQPHQKPKTRGSCVVSLDVEVENYY